MTPFELTIPDRNFECGNCGRCCHIWNVELLPADIKRLTELKWDAGDPTPTEYLATVAGKTVLAHRADGACIFYDTDHKGCMIHHRFGYAAKPVGCRLYPFQLATTFSNTVSATIRFECPSVRRNEGKPMAKRASEFRGMAAELGLPGNGFDRPDLNGLDPHKCRQIVKAMVQHVFLNQAIPSPQRLVVAQSAITRLERLGTVFINDTDLTQILPSLFERLVDENHAAPSRGLGALGQAQFLSLLLSFLRRDEEQLGQGFPGRIKRTAALFSLLNGKTNLRKFSREYPDFAITRKEFFSQPVANGEELDLEGVFGFIRHRLESYQFFGQPVYGRSFFFGCRTLFMNGALVLAYGKWRAMSRSGLSDSCRIDTDDIAEGTSVIHHAYGRSRFLNLGFMTTLQRHVCEDATFRRIINELLRGTSD